MNTHITPLVITPKPFLNESLKGLILRTSELNGYNSPCVMLSAAGMNENQMHSVIPPLELLAPLFNRSLDEMKKIGYWRPWENRYQKSMTIFDHQLPSYYLSVKYPKICTECILESGYIDGYWDLKHAIACPTHMRAVLRGCPECKKRLSWFRPGLLTCSCGCDLSSYVGAKIENQEVLGLLSILRSKFLRQSYDKIILSDQLGFPVEHLDALKLSELISIIGRLENRIPGSNRRNIIEFDNPSVETILQQSALALSHWPKGLFEYLNSFNNERASIQGFGLRKQFESFYGSLFKSDIPKENISFIKDAFIIFGNEEWKQGYVPRKLGDKVVQASRIVGINGLAKSLGVMPSTAKNMVKRDLIKGKTSEFNGKTRYFFDTTQELPFKVVAGLSLTLRKAAAWLGLPVSVLKILRQRKQFEVRHLANPVNAYHEQDLIAFNNKLLKCCPADTNFLEDIHITLKQLMLMKAGSAEVKTYFVNSIINRELKLLGNSGSNLAGMFFARSQMNELMLKAKKIHLGLTTVVSAAKYLHCDPLVVKSLYQMGVLAGDQKTGGLYIRDDSLNAFAGLYISCADIASRHETNSSKIVRHCKDKQIDLHWFTRIGHKSPQPFIKREIATKDWKL